MNLKIEISRELNKELEREIDDLNEFSLVPKISTTSFYLKVYEKYMLGDWKPLFVKILNEENKKVLGIIPLMYQDIYKKRIIPYRIVKFYASTFSDFHDIYSKQENRMVVINTFLDWLCNSKFNWQELVLDDLLESTNIISELEKYVSKNKINHEVLKRKYFYIDLDQSFEDIKKDTSKSFVWKNVRLAKNRITKAGEWSFEFCPNLSATEIVERIQPIHKERQRSLDRSSRVNTENGALAFNKVIDHFQSQNEFKTFWLKFEDKYIAYMLGFYIDNVFYWWNTGFLPEYKDFYPSRFLQYYAVEYMNENGFKELNFMRGESDYKKKWTKSYRLNYRMKLYNSKNFYGKILGLFDSNFK